MVTLALAIFYLAYMLAIIASFASYWLLALWVRLGRLPLFARVVVIGLPLYMIVLLAISPLARRAAISWSDSYRAIVNAAWPLLIGFAATYLIAFVVGKLTARFGHWLLMVIPVWIAVFFGLGFAWALSFYYLAGALDCSPGAYECP